MELPSSIEGVVDITRYECPRATRQADEPTSRSVGSKGLLIEVPHGATRKSDYDAVFAQMKSALPEQLEHFFFVNTDIGAPEGAAFLARALSAKGISVVIARCLIPRTFIDTNRVVAKSDGQTNTGEVKHGLTPGIAAYIDGALDAPWLIEQHRRYHAAVERLYQQICGVQHGLALQLHSYSPRSVGIEKIDGEIVRALHAAYQPEIYKTWPERPAIDLISATEDGSFRTAPKLVAELLREYAADGIEAKENATYHLHPVTMGYVYAAAHPGQVVCVEMNRGLIADPFVPFGVSPINESKLAKLVSPIERVLEAQL